MTFTFFFRDIESLKHVAELMVPIAQNGKSVRVWDAGSSKGCEPFSFAIILSEMLNDRDFGRLLMDTSDIDENNVFGKIIENGIYPYTDLSRIPKDLFNKYFTETDKEKQFKITDKILSRVDFFHNDLRDLKPKRNDYNLIICKNVLLHIEPEERIDVIKMFHKSLAPGGIFTTEISQEMPKENAHLFEKIAGNRNIYRKIG